MRAQVDSKCDYRAACNAMETLLFHEDAACAKACVDALRAKGVELLGTPRALEAGLADAPVTEPERHEYGCLTCRVDIVDQCRRRRGPREPPLVGPTDCVVAKIRV